MSKGLQSGLKASLLEMMLDAMVNHGKDSVRTLLQARFPHDNVRRDLGQPFAWTLTSRVLGDASMSVSFEADTLQLKSHNSGMAASYQLPPLPGLKVEDLSVALDAGYRRYLRVHREAARLPRA